MVSLLVVLFFAATGVTLNHPDWLAGERTEELTGTLPASWKTPQGIDRLVVAEHLRAVHGVHGTLADRTADESRGRDAGSAWAWLVDVAGGFLVLLSLTGLGLLFYLRKVRVSGLVTLAAGAALVVMLAMLAA
jgi:hypothetical protein